jgi:geranylgeranyl diphosphate synthase type II
MENNYDFKALEEDLLSKIESRIVECIIDKEPHSLYAPFKYIMEPSGKRIRPMLAVLSAGAVSGNPLLGLDSGVAIEILHNFTLAHDDIMDRSPMRRNRPTLHVKWNEAVAILTGDVMVGCAYNLLPSPTENNTSYRINQEFTNGLIEVCEGQAYDMDFNTLHNVTLDQYILMITKKTARLLEASTVIGGLCGSGTDEQIEALRNFANSLGIAFQIQDDLLDLTAKQAELGKTIGQDILEGKKTYFIIKATELAKTEADKTLLNKFYTNNGLSAEEVPYMNEMFGRLNIFETAQSKIEEYLIIAKTELTKLPDNQYTMMLNRITDKLNKRNK